MMLLSGKMKDKVIGYGFLFMVIAVITLVGIFT